MKQDNIKINPFKSFLLYLLSTIGVILLFIISFYSEKYIDGGYKENWKLILLIVVVLIYIIETFIFNLLVSFNKIEAQRKYEKELVEKISEKNDEFFINHNSGELINSLNNISRKVASFNASYRYKIYTELLNTILVLYLIFRTSYLLGIILLTSLIIFLVLNKFIASKVSEAMNNYLTGYGKVSNDIIEIYNNYRVIKNLESSRFFFNKYKREYEKNIFKNGKKYYFLYTIFVFIYFLIKNVLPIVSLVIGLYLKNKNIISVGMVLIAYQMSSKLDTPIVNLSELVVEYKQNKQLEKSLNYLYEEDIDSRTILKEDFENIKFESNGYKLDDKNIILNDLSFDIKKNDFVSLVGNSGCGKSTIFKFILNQINDPNVKVKYNDINVVDYNMNRNIKLVTQTNYLLHDTIKENLCMGNVYAEDEIEEISKICVLDSFISKYGLDKEIDNESNNISGGEKTRICLARILLRKPQVLLLDEICAALDKKTSDIIANNIYEYAKKYNITVISISHKDEFFKYSNKIINVQS